MRSIYWLSETLDDQVMCGFCSSSSQWGHHRHWKYVLCKLVMQALTTNPMQRWTAQDNGLCDTASKYSSAEEMQLTPSLSSSLYGDSSCSGPTTTCRWLAVADCDSRCSSLSNLKRFNCWKHGCSAYVDGCWASSSPAPEATSAVRCYFYFRFWVDAYLKSVWSTRETTSRKTTVIFALWTFIQLNRYLNDLISF